MKYRLKILSNALLSCALLACSSPEPVNVITEPASATVFESSKAWEEFEAYFQLFYAYSDRMDFDVERALDATRKRALKTKTKEDFRTELVRFGHVFADPHIIIGPLGDQDFNVVPTSADMRVVFRNNQYVIADVRAGSAADISGIKPGFVLSNIDDAKISETVTAFFEGLVTEPTLRQKSHVATLLVNGKRSGERRLTFAKAGQSTLPNTREFARSLQGQDPFSVSYAGDIAIIRFHNSLGNNDTIKAFDAAMMETASAPGLILDMRETPSGGNTEVGRSIIGHFVTEARPYQTHQIPSLEREFTVPRQFTEYVLPRAPYRNPKEVVALASYWTGSMGEGVIIGLDGAADMHIIASDMADLLGGLSNYDLKASGLRLDLPSEVLLHVDGSPREDFIADQPLISAERDAAGGDPALQAALQYLGAP